MNASDASLRFLPGIGVETDAREQIIMGRLMVEAPAGSAHQIMTGVTRRLEETLGQAAEAEMARFKTAYEIATRQVAEARRALAELQEKRQKLLESASISDLSREAILEMSRRWETERQDTAIKLETLRARQDAVRRRIAEIDHQKVRAASEAELEAARERHAAMKQQLEKLKTTERKPSADEFAKVEEALKRAEMELQARLQQQQRGAARFSKTVEDMNDELSAMSIDLTESEVRLKTLDAKCLEMRNLLSKADDYELQVGLELPLARSVYENARRRQEHLTIRLDSIRPPTVTVLGG